MTTPTTREQFKQYCLRRLGAPVIQINVDDEQTEDRIDEALKYYQDYHFDGSEHILYKHIVTAQDRTNGYITLPNTIVGIRTIIPINSNMNGSSSGSSLFNINYQLHMNDVFDGAGVSYGNYVMSQMNFSSINEIFNGTKPLRFNRHVNKLYIDMNWTTEIAVGEYLVVEAYQITDPDTYSDVWGDRWLARYATALIKRQWGDNMSKFSGMQMPGGLTFNGEKVRDDAQTELDKLEEEMIASYSLPVTDMIG